jgi:cation diffusion facilitator CzcD-associated flavoprotein CzcO
VLTNPTLTRLFLHPTYIMSPAPPENDRGPIRFIVVGGSVAGLCAAYTLRQSGHDVVVLEKRDERLEVGAPRRIWTFSNLVTESTSKVIRRPPCPAEYDAVIGNTPWDEKSFADSW